MIVCITKIYQPLKAFSENQILFLKADCPKNKTIEQVVKGNHVLKKLKVFGKIQVFSSKNLTGLDEFKESLSSWF